MNNYRWIDYPSDIDDELKTRYEKIADEEIAAAISPICVVWCSDPIDWIDDDGSRPDQGDCLLVLHHVQVNEDEWTFGSFIKTIKLNS